MNLRQASIAAAVAFLSATGMPVMAQIADAQVDHCKNADGEATPEVAIAACTALIQSGRLDNDELVAAHRNRADLYADQEDSGRAALDYTEVIRLAPMDFRSYRTRGMFYELQGDSVRSIADYSEAIRILRRTLSFTYELRGDRYRVLGDAAREAADRELEYLLSD